MKEATREVLAKGKVVTKKQEPTKPGDVADMLKDLGSTKRTFESSEDLERKDVVDSEQRILELSFLLAEKEGEEVACFIIEIWLFIFFVLICRATDALCSKTGASGSRNWFALYVLS